jgi:hypothetical protein
MDEAPNGRRGNGGDPTLNVLSLVYEATKRQDDLRVSDNKYVEAEIVNIKAMACLRDTHSKEIRIAEADRVNASRQVDVAATKTEADRALQAIQALAATTATNAETLRNALTSTAATIAKQTSDTVSQITERIAALEKSSYEGVGKQRVSDPMMNDLVAEMKRLATAQDSGSGKSQGIGASWAVAVALVSMFLGIGALIYSLTRTEHVTTPTPPQIIYLPAVPPK